MKHKLKQTLAGLLAAGMLASPALAASFPDVSSSASYAEAVEYVSDIGLMVGDEQGKFNPNKTVTRAEMAAIISRIRGEDDWGREKGWEENYRFTDVPTNHWACYSISMAARMKIVNGYGDGRFGPSDKVTYEQGTTMIVRAYGLESDAAFAGGYPDGYITVARNNGLTADISSQIGSDLTRAQVAKMLYNSATSKVSVWALQKTITDKLAEYSVTYLKYCGESKGIVSYCPQGKDSFLAGVEYERSTGNVKLYNMSGRLIKTFPLNR